MSPGELHRFAPSSGGLGATAALVLFVLVLRRLLPADRRGRGRVAIALLVLGAVFHVGANGAAAIGAAGVNDVLGLLTTFCLVLGAAAVAGMLLFDISAPRTHIRIPSILRDLIQAVAVFVIAIGVLRRSGVDLLSLVATSAVVTAVIGLALQNTIANIFAGLALEIDRSLDIGDWIQVGGQVGRIAEINWRSTQMMTKDGDTVIVPNAQLLSHEVLNFSKPSHAHRMWLRVGFHYRHPPNDVRQVLVEAVRGTPGVLGTPSPDCFPLDYAESAVTYALRYWIADLIDDAAIDGEVRTRVWYAARRAGLEMPFPIRTVLTSATPAEEANVEGEKADRVSALGGIDLFAPLALAERVHLASSLRTERFGRGEQIVRQGDPGNSLYLICTGEVAVHLEGDGVRREVATLRARDFFGEMSLMTGEPHSATCTAKSDAVCYVLQHTALRQLLAERSQIAEDLSAVLARRTALLDDQRAGLSEEARARREAEARSHLLARIREFFYLH